MTANAGNCRHPARGGVFRKSGTAPPPALFITWENAPVFLYGLNPADEGGFAVAMENGIVPTRGVRYSPVTG